MALATRPWEPNQSRSELQALAIGFARDVTGPASMTVLLTAFARLTLRALQIMAQARIN